MGKSLYAVGSYKEYDMNNRFFNINLAGGALLDIGVYALSLMRSFMAETPDQVMSQVRFAPTGTDEQDRKSTRLNSSHIPLSRMPSSA